MIATMTSIFQMAFLHARINELDHNCEGRWPGRIAFIVNIAKHLFWNNLKNIEHMICQYILPSMITNIIFIITLFEVVVSYILNIEVFKG